MAEIGGTAEGLIDSDNHAIFNRHLIKARPSLFFFFPAIPLPIYPALGSAAYFTHPMQE